ncbi:hypothetical protein SELMODRAFT_29243, partial [Selaginella moellendorffii]
LREGEFLQSPNLVFILYMRFDCNLVLYYGKISIWDTETSGKGIGCFLRFQKDGNLVIYNQYHNVVWS